jgi:hypothetical protein
LDAPLKKIKSVREFVGPYVEKRAVVYSPSVSVDEAGTESPLNWRSLVVMLWPNFGSVSLLDGRDSKISL